MNLSDEDLVSALQQGDFRAYQKVYERHKDAMLRLGLRILGNLADAEDAVQDAFLNLYRGVGEFRKKSSFSTWLYRITINACLKIRRNRPPVEHARELAEPGERGGRGAEALSEAHEALQREMLSLPLRQRMVFTLSQVEGLSPAAVGETLGLNPGTVRFHLFRAREKLRQRLKPFLENPAQQGMGAAQRSGAVKDP